MRTIRKPLILLAAGLVFASRAGFGAVTVNCPFEGRTGDVVGGEAFYVKNYTANNLGKVQMRMGGSVIGPHVASLTVRAGAFNGPLLGAKQIVAFPVSVACPPDCSYTDETSVIFDFGGVAVTPGSTLAFITQVEQEPAHGHTFFDVGSGPCQNVFETLDSAPPLSTVRRPTVGLIVTSIDPGPCVADSTTLCLDALPNDRRFRIELTAHTVQSGGLTREGTPLSLKPLGVTHGGVFSIFSPDNPEVLVKVLNGCPLNNRQWVFISAGTNVGYTLSIVDTLTRAHRSYSNADLHAASPVQDTTVGLPCPQ